MDYAENSDINTDTTTDSDSGLDFDFSSSLSDYLFAAYMYASMPSYLYSHYKSLLQAVAFHAPRFDDVGVLIAVYNKNAAIEPQLRTSSNIVEAYAMLVLISLLPKEQAISIYDSLNLRLLQWGEYIARYVRNGNWN